MKLPLAIIVALTALCCVIAVVAYRQGEDDGRDTTRQMPFLPSANRWQIFVAPPGEAEFSNEVTLGDTWAEAVANLDPRDPPAASAWTGPHWRVVDCRPLSMIGDRWCNAVYR